MTILSTSINFFLLTAFVSFCAPLGTEAMMLRARAPDRSVSGSKPSVDSPADVEEEEEEELDPGSSAQSPPPPEESDLDAGMSPATASAAVVSSFATASDAEPPQNQPESVVTAAANDGEATNTVPAVMQPMFPMFPSSPQEVAPEVGADAADEAFPPQELAPEVGTDAADEALLPPTLPIEPTATQQMFPMFPTSPQQVVPEARAVAGAEAVIQVKPPKASPLPSTPTYAAEGFRGKIPLRLVSMNQTRPKVADWPPSLEASSQCDPPCIEGRGTCNDNVCFCRSPYAGSTCQHTVEGLYRAPKIMVVGFACVCILLGLLLSKLIFSFSEQAIETRLQQYGTEKQKAETWQPPEAGKNSKSSAPAENSGL